MTDTIRYKFLKPTSWPHWFHQMVSNSGLLDDWLNAYGLKSVDRSKVGQKKIFDRVAEFNKTKSYYPLELEVIDNSVWVTVASTPEITLAILTEQ